MDFGQRLKSLRVEQNLTQQNLGDAVGVSTVTIRAWERNTKKPAMDALLSLGRVLNISMDTLLDFHLNNAPNYTLVLTSSERKLLSSYQSLDNYGQKQLMQSVRLRRKGLMPRRNLVLFPKSSICSRLRASATFLAIPLPLLPVAPYLSTGLTSR